MPSCEKCWRDSRLAEASGVELAYSKLVAERTASGLVCTPEDQAGEGATECPRCRRRTVHQHAKVCMTQGCTEATAPAPEDAERP